MTAGYSARSVATEEEDEEDEEAEDAQQETDKDAASVQARKEEIWYKKKFLLEELHGIDYAYQALQNRVEAEKYDKKRSHNHNNLNWH